MEEQKKLKWYFRTSSLLVAFLCVGPLALPLIWFNPRLGLRSKVLISAVTLFLTYLLIVGFARFLKLLLDYYQQLRSI